MSSGGQKSGENKMSVSNSMPPLIDFGEDNEIWGCGSSIIEQVSAASNILLQSETERESFKDLMDYKASNSENPDHQTPCVQKPENISFDLFSNQTPSIYNSSGSSLHDDVSLLLSESKLDLLSSRTHSMHRPSSTSSYDGVTSLPRRPLDLLSDVCISTALLASKPDASVRMPEFVIDDAAKPETSAEFGIDDASLHQDDLFGTCSSESLNSEYTNPFGSPPSALAPANVFHEGHSGLSSCEDSSQSLPYDPFKSSSEFQLGSTDTFLNQSWPGIENLLIAHEDHSDLGSWEANFGSGVSSAGHQGKRSPEHLDDSANQQSRSTLWCEVSPGTDNLKPNSMQRTTECLLIEATEVCPHGQNDSNVDLKSSKPSKLVGDIHQETRKSEGPGAVSAPSLEEFVASGGGKGIFKVPTREVIRLGRPAFLELRPHPLRETQDAQAICTIICTGNRLWAGQESGIRFWDIDKAYNIGGESNSILGDEDAAPFVFLQLHESPTMCLAADAARNIVWSGHRDGKVRGWSIDMSSDAVSPKFTWRAHLGPVLSIVVTSYGELWTGSEAGSIRVWAWEDLKMAISSNLEKHRNKSDWIESCSIDLRSRLTAIGASILSTDIRFLIYNHSDGRIWSGGSYCVALWDARVKEVLKIFGSDAQTEFLNSDLLPGQGVSLDSEMKMNFSKFSKKEKIQGTLTFLQRSKNALLGAADAVRASLGGPFLDDNRKIQAMVASVDGIVWTGYANGSLVCWDHQGNQLQEFQNTYVGGIHCLCAFRTGLWIGYADGRVQIIERSGKVLKGWLAHSSTVHQMAVGSDHVFTLAAHGGIRGWNVAILTPFESILRSKLIEMEPDYTRKGHIKILAGTWNVSQGRASFDSLRCWLASPASEANIVVIGLQEIEMGAGVLAIAAAKETVGIEGSVNGIWWLESIDDAIDNDLFVRVGSRQLAGLLIGAWVRRDLVRYVGDVDVGAVACGFGRALGNKGAVAIKMRVFRRTMCIVNSHFAAHLDATARRNADFDYIYRSMTFGRFASGVNVAANAVTAGVSSAVQMLRGVNARRSSQSLDMGGQYDGRFSTLSIAESLPQEVMPELAQADMIIWLGDFNYRLNDTSYEYAIDCIKRKQIGTLLEKDQLREEMKAGRVFQGMREGKISFPPTYKFDRGQQAYDSSEKRRVPAWCDRILFRDGRSEKSAKCKLSCPIVSSIEWYNACADITDSDHKPVMCMFNIDIAFIDEATRREKYGYLVRTSKTEL